MGLFDQFLKDLLDEEPKLSYFAEASKYATSPRARSFYESEFGSIFDQYLGALGRQAQEGKMPDIRWADWIDEFSFQNYFRSRPPELRGERRSLFAPPVRWKF